MKGAVSFDPGWLRHRVVIEAPAAAADGAGGGTLSWTAVATAWALIEPVSGAERIVAGSHTGVVTHVVTLRHRSDVAGGMRILFRGRVHRVLAAYDPDERQRYLALKTEVETP
jgi:SPP1 family predicted phage head-tail adaptor